MEIPKAELFSVLQEFNPWWTGQPVADLPDWERAASRQIRAWIDDRETKRALLLTGARQVGKTTLFRQAIRRLVAEGFPPANLLYATFDHPILKLAGLERTLQAWDELFPPVSSHPRMLFLDEIQFVPDWQTWLKHQSDFQRGRRIAATGSASPLRDASTESGVGRWETIPLPTLSFAEYLRLRKVEIPALPEVRSLRHLFDWSPGDFSRAATLGRPLTAHFHEYLLRGGFPEPALVNDLTRCQRLLREDIVDKVLKRDMTASPYIPGKGYPVEAEGVKELLKMDDWNQMRIEVRGTEYAVSLNGKKVMTYKSESGKAKGPIGLQLHGDRDMAIDYRNLKVGEL